VSIVEDAQMDQDRFYTLNPEEIGALTQLVRGYEKRYKIKQKQLKEDRKKLRAMDIRSAKHTDLSRRIDREERQNKELKSSYDGEPKRRIAPYNRLARIDITNEKQFRAIKKDFMDIQVPPKVKTEDELKQEQIKELEDKVRRYKIAGFFPTPRPVANKVYNYADITPEHSVLEPSAGNGWLADAIAERSGRKPSQIDVVEYNYDLRQILTLKGYHVVGNDFLEYDKQKYDRIVMNPPFEKDQDIIHVKHAYSLLKPHGRVVAIMSSGVKFRSTGQAPAFRSWVDEKGGTIEDLPEGSFKSSFITTGVNTVIVTIDKSEVREIESIRGVTEKQVINYIPEESVEKMGREWWVKTMQGKTFPNPFKTKKAAIEQAKRHKDLWEDTFDDPERWVRVEEIKYR
jgi:methylase of polypeptide subunit release factors